MNILQKINNKQKDLIHNGPITIAFLGDSVTQGCFECYLTSETSLETVFDYKSAFSTRLKEIINILYPNVQINIVNSGISGDGSANGLKRLERDVISYNPDLVVVSYGLNDSCSYSLEEYKNNLSAIFSKLKEKNIDFIFLTQNAMCTKTSCHLKDHLFKNLSIDFAKIQNSGKLASYFDVAKKTTKEYNGKVCDLYPVWEKMIENGVDTTELLANKLNHPIREFHYYIAIKLLETMFSD